MSHSVYRPGWSLHGTRMNINNLHDCDTAEAAARVTEKLIGELWDVSSAWVEKIEVTEQFVSTEMMVKSGTREWSSTKVWSEPREQD